MAIVTVLADPVDDFRGYARAFKVDGGAVGYGENYGEVIEEVVVLQNLLRNFFDANTGEWQCVLDRHRTTYRGVEEFARVGGGEKWQSAKS
jgi:hypothetical protein